MEPRISFITLGVRTISGEVDGYAADFKEEPAEAENLRSTSGKMRQPVRFSPDALAFPSWGH